MTFTLKITKNGKTVSKMRTYKIRRFLKVIRSLNWQDSVSLSYIKVGYGKKVDNYGKLTNFHNDGEYDNKEDFWWAFNAFTEK